MPRPGPRPYECVRRAWHSDRHQPIRGSLIQEIFRIVSEVHNSATKKNKEWQEKLPVVVLKTEEIMYSKANSEAEYMDYTTLWDRVNDAINTIIRRDDSAETSDLLQPCIEAALQLGCIPRRASRSQRDNDPRRYLSPNSQEPMSSCFSNLENTITSPHCMAMFNNAGLPQQEVPVDNIPLNTFPRHFPPLISSSPSVDSETCRTSGAVQGNLGYPLYYWGNDPELRCNSFPMKKTSPKDMTATKNPKDTKLSDTPQTVPHLSCDLSLRLGPSGGFDNIDKQSHHQEFQYRKPKKTELNIFPNEDLGKPRQKCKTLSLACSNHPAEEMICLLQPQLRNGHGSL